MTLRIWLCACCTKHEGGEVDWDSAACRECGQPCSCIGCIADTAEMG